MSDDHAHQIHAIVQTHHVAPDEVYRKSSGILAFWLASNIAENERQEAESKKNKPKKAKINRSYQGGGANGTGDDA
ncbi:hypothetical protein JCM19037_1558 [Geomicrobium sp. JCM 19037]|uniref:hypothetical protein n=1 Tax=Geomicrobium sp. JCM 19037 TaxID=1460634 RepID=UPI00045F2D20|nr:hypothetical protein [Geomicrobium sp. JCM 19037]GAK03251.1 hypothetical protein JCM19037_1558 [Geomicrobium sp. JCM 19037]